MHHGWTTGRLCWGGPKPWEFVRLQLVFARGQEMSRVVANAASNSQAPDLSVKETSTPGSPVILKYEVRKPRSITKLFWLPWSGQSKGNKGFPIWTSYSAYGTRWINGILSLWMHFFFFIFWRAFGLCRISLVRCRVKQEFFFGFLISPFFIQKDHFCRALALWRWEGSGDESNFQMLDETLLVSPQSPMNHRVLDMAQ